MTTKSAPPPRPGWQHPLLVPGVLIVISLLFLVSGNGAFAFAFLMGALGMAMYLFGKARRWKGAPEAGMIVGVVGIVIALWALFG